VNDSQARRVGGAGEGAATAPAAGFLPRKAQWALRLALVLLLVYVVLDVVAQLLPPHYSPVTQAESDLAVGPFGYVMTVNFVVRGILSLSFLVGLVGATTLGRRSPLGVGLLGAWGLGAFVLAASPTDVGTATTLHGMIHLVTAALAFVAAAVGEVILSIRSGEEPRLAGIRTPALLLSVLAVLALLVLLYLQQRPRLLDEAFGLVERVFLGLVLLWIAFVSVALLRSGRTRSPSGGAGERGAAAGSAAGGSRQERVEEPNRGAPKSEEGVVKLLQAPAKPVL